MEHVGSPDGLSLDLSHACPIAHMPHGTHEAMDLSTAVQFGEQGLACLIASLYQIPCDEL